MSAGANAAGSSGTVCSRLPLISSISTGSRSAGGLLLEDGLSVTEAATACGFGHLSYFSKLFREALDVRRKNAEKALRSSRHKTEQNLEFF